MNIFLWLYGVYLLDSSIMVWYNIYGDLKKYHYFDGMKTWLLSNIMEWRGMLFVRVAIVVLSLYFMHRQRGRNNTYNQWKDDSMLIMYRLQMGLGKFQEIFEILKFYGKFHFCVSPRRLFSLSPFPVRPMLFKR